MSRSTAGTGARRPYTRTMTGWYKRDRFFVRYMWREATALMVMAYAVVLMFGVLRLSQGPAAFEGWLAALRNPISLAAHAVMLAAMIYHAYTWFEIMPKTMPAMHSGGKRVPEATITRVGMVAAVVTNLALLALAWGVAR